MEPGGELISSKWNVVEKDGKSLWNVNRDSSGINYENYGIHKTKYTTYKCFKRYRSIIELYDLNGDKLDSSSEQGYFSAVTVTKNGRIIKTLSLNKDGKLIEPTGIKWAKMTQKFYKNGTFRQRFYGSDNQPSCKVPAFQYLIQPDTVQLIFGTDSTFGVRNIVLEKLDCNKVIIE